MRTNIAIDDALMRKAMRAAGTKTKKATVDAALELLVRVRGQAAFLKSFGAGHVVEDVRERAKSRSAQGL